MPPTPSQLTNPEAPAFVEAPQVVEAPQASILDIGRRKLTAAVLAGTTLLAGISGGLATRVCESSASPKPAVLERTFEQPILSGRLLERSLNAGTASAKSRDESKIAKMAKDCPTTVIVNPSHPKKRQDHRVNKKVGRLDVIRGKINKYVFSRKNLGIKVCGFSGAVPGYMGEDGKIVYGREIVLKFKKVTNKKYVAIDPKVNGKSLTTVSTYARQS